MRALSAAAVSNVLRFDPVVTGASSFDAVVESLDPSFSPADGDPNENVGILGATGGFSEVVVVDAGVPNENAGLVVVEEVEDASLSVVVVVAPNLNGDAAADDVVVAVVIAGVVVVVVVVLAKGEGPCLGDVDPNENVDLSAVVVAAAAGFSVVDFSVVAGFSVEAAAGVVVLPN